MCSSKMAEAINRNCIVKNLRNHKFKLFSEYVSIIYEIFQYAYVEIYIFQELPFLLGCFQISILSVEFGTHSMLLKF